MRYLIILLFLLPSVVMADEWTKADTVREATYLALHIADWGQTLDAVKNPDKFNEENFLLGKHPSVPRVNSYFATTAILHVGVAYLLPSRWRDSFQYVSIGMEASVVLHNNSVGLRINFR